MASGHPQQPTAATSGLWIASLGGACPVQAHGLVCGHPFYFRARNGDWTLAVADDDPVGVTCADGAGAILWLDGDDDTMGWMAHGPILAILWHVWRDVANRIANGKMEVGPGILPDDLKPSHPSHGPLSMSAEPDMPSIFHQIQGG